MMCWTVTQCGAVMQGPEVGELLMMLQSEDGDVAEGVEVGPKIISYLINGPAHLSLIYIYLLYVVCCTIYPAETVL